MIGAMERRALTAAAALILAACACAHPSSGGAPSGDPPGASASATSDTPPSEPTPSAVPPAPDAELASPSAERIPAAFLPLDPAEPRRSVLRRVADERALAPYEARIREHFEGTIPSPLEVQTSPLPGERRAFLVYGEPRRRHPFLLVTSAAGELLWTKERPLAGTRQVVTEMVVTPGPRGEVALLWCDIPTQVVGLRRWAADGAVLADFEVLEVDVCEALSGLYWPGRGWVVVASQHGAARAQRLDDAGKRSWGPRGNELPWTARPSSPASIAVDSDVSVVLLQAGFRHTEGEGSAAADRVLAMRYDTLGTALWPQPIDLGVAPQGPAPRIPVARVEPGRVRVSIAPRGTAIVTSAGSILGGR